MLHSEWEMVAGTRSLCSLFYRCRLHFNYINVTAQNKKFLRFSILLRMFLFNGRLYRTDTDNGHLPVKFNWCHFFSFYFSFFIFVAIVLRLLAYQCFLWERNFNWYVKKFMYRTLFIDHQIRIYIQLYFIYLNMSISIGPRLHVYIIGFKIVYKRELSLFISTKRKCMEKYT